ncbi:hypothetical protein Barb7_00863 [Bacteroidales bacterium Barb7]|nr:hypothetical protein Barb7_00863 [Bacteroidales bacterium Barb7]
MVYYRLFNSIVFASTKGISSDYATNRLQTHKVLSLSRTLVIS